MPVQALFNRTQAKAFHLTHPLKMMAIVAIPTSKPILFYLIADLSCLPNFMGTDRARMSHDLNDMNNWSGFILMDILPFLQKWKKNNLNKESIAYLGV